MPTNGPCSVWLDRRKGRRLTIGLERDDEDVVWGSSWSRPPAKQFPSRARSPWPLHSWRSGQPSRGSPSSLCRGGCRDAECGLGGFHPPRVDGHCALRVGALGSLLVGLSGSSVS